MAFQEYVKLITDAHETLNAIARVNEAIQKLRHEAAAPIILKIQDEMQKVAAGEKRMHGDRKAANEEEEKSLKKRLEQYKAMNMARGGSYNNTKDAAFGPIRPVINSELDKQIEATVKKLNELKIAKSKIASVAQEAGIELSKAESGKLAGQTVANAERELIRLQKEKIALKKAELDLWVKQTQMTQKLKAENNKIEADAGGRAQVAMENEALRIERERIAAVRERNAQEEYGAKHVISEAKEALRIQEQAEHINEKMDRDRQRMADRAKREQETQIASARQGGIRGMAGEVVRDSRRALVYGSIGKVEQLAAEAYKADVERSTVEENLRQAGRTSSEIQQMTEKASQLAKRYPTLTVSELMQTEQHNIGAVGDFRQGMRNVENSAAYQAIRKNKVGEEKALGENISLQKVGEELGKINDQGFMHRMYNRVLQVSQTEGSLFDPEQMLQMVRMTKSSKFALSEKMLLGIMPFLGMAEGMGRSGNEIAMLMKSLTYAGASISKQTKGEIAGTIMSNGKGGYNPEMAQLVAAGDLTGIIGMVDKYLKQKGLDTEDKSDRNKVAMMQALAPLMANQNSREALITFVENKAQFDKQGRMADQAQGFDAADNIASRTLQGSQDAIKSTFDNMSAALLGPWNHSIINFNNGVARMQMWATDHPGNIGTAAVGFGAAGLAGLAAAIAADPQKSQQTTYLAAIAVNTGISAKASGLGGVGAGGGIMGKVLGTVGGAAAGVAIQQGIIQPFIDDYNNKEQEAAVNNLRNNPEVLAKEIAQLPGLIKNNTTNIPTERLANELRLALEAQRRNERDSSSQAIKDKAGSDFRTSEHQYSGKVWGKNKHGRPILVDPPAFRPNYVEPPQKEQFGPNVPAGYRFPEPSDPQIHLARAWSLPNWGDYNSGGVVNNGRSARDNRLDETTGSVGGGKLDTNNVMQTSFAKIQSAGDAAGVAISGAASAISGGGAAAGSEIAGAGGAVVSALHGIAAEIAAVKISGPTAGVQPVAGGSVGHNPMGPR